MANHPSAQKRNRQRVVRTERNRAAKSSVRSAVKKARSAIAAGDKAAATAVLSASTSVIDSIADKKIVHKNAAARHKSRLAAALKSMG